MAIILPQKPVVAIACYSEFNQEDFVIVTSSKDHEYFFYYSSLHIGSKCYLIISQCFMILLPSNAFPQINYTSYHPCFTKKDGRLLILELRWEGQ